MGRLFWIKRFLLVASLVFAVLMAVELLKGRGLETAATFSLTWSLAASAIFTATRIYRSRKGQHCELCRDTPESKPPPPGGVA